MNIIMLFSAWVVSGFFAGIGIAILFESIFIDQEKKKHRTKEVRAKDIAGAISWGTCFGFFSVFIGFAMLVVAVAILLQEKLKGAILSMLDNEVKDEL